MPKYSNTGRVLVVLLCALLTITRASAQTPADVDRLFAAWDRKDSPGCAVAVIRDGKILHQRGYGMADLEHNRPITPDTVFNIASVSKHFTVFLILLLVHAGLLSLDDDVRRFVPEVPDFGKTITVRQLIHHTSGLREDWSMLTLAGWRSEDVILREDVFQLIRRQKELNFAPGEDYSYCNTGYHLLAEIARKVSGKSLRELGQERIFEPLGMKQTVFQDDHRQIIPGRAASYAPKKGGGFERILYGAGRAGPGNLHTTILDLAKWDQNFYAPKVGNAKVIAESLTKAKLNNGKVIDYGGGLRLSTYRGLDTVEHGGVIAGFRSHLLRFPDQKFTVVILANVSSFKPSVVARRVADLYLDKQFQPPVKPGPTPSVQTLKDFAGEYRFPSGLLAAFAEEKGELFLKGDLGNLRLLPVGTGEFLESETGSRYVFARGTVVYRGFGLDQVGTKIERPKWTPAQLAEFVGMFHSEELDVLFSTQVRDGKLYLKHRKGEVELQPLAPDEFSAAPGTIFTTLHFSRNASKALTGFTVSTPRVRHLRFDRIALARS